MTAPHWSGPSSLTPLLMQARRRWRIRHLAVGSAVTVAALATVLLGGSIALEALRFTPSAITTARFVAALIAVAVCARWIAWPLLRRLPDDRLALYLEERVPQLGGAVLTAVTLRPSRDGGSSVMLERGVVTDASRRLAASPAVPALERPVTLRAFAIIVAVMAVSVASFTFGPAFLRLGVRRLLAPTQAAAAAPVYTITLDPRSIIVARGSDVQLSAAPGGFNASGMELVVRRGTSAEWERLPMSPGSSRGAYTIRLFDVAEDAEFYAESNGVRSNDGRLTVRDLPGVERIGVELRYPSYMGMTPDVTEDGGDIAAPGGTTAVLRVHTTRAVTGGTLIFDGGATVPLQRVNDSTVTARVEVRRDASYRVDLVSADNTVVHGTVEYIVDALDDAPPSVHIRRPGRDLRPTSVDEVMIEAEATDDYGVGRLEVAYRVNGGEEKVVVLAAGSGARPREVVATHTLFLEEMNLTAGDVVSFHARALDNDQRPRPKSAASDIRFLTIRPFRRDYRQNQQGGGGEGGGPQEMNPGSLVERQRDIVAATFKTERDRVRTPAAVLRGDISTLHLSQGRLREELASLQKRVERPAAQAADTSFRILAEVLPKAAAAMQAAQELLVQGRTADALGPEQRALQWLEKAQAAFREVQVSMQQQGGGGNGGGGAQASDLADLLELQTDKMRNQYAAVQRSREEGGATRTDETLERLKQLAARQQQELTRQRAQQRDAGGGGSQRALAEETEAAARQLERLAREQQSPQLSSAAQEMQRAADAMRRSAASGGGANAQAAADKLQEAQRALADARAASRGSTFGDATTRARELAAEQRGVQRDVEQLAAAGAGAGAERAERQQRLDERKGSMEQRVSALEADLDRASRENRTTNPRAARAARDAAASMRVSRLADKIRYSRDALRRSGSSTYARNIEQSIQLDLDSLERRVSAASGAARSGLDSAQRSSRALAQARDLVRGLTSLDERLRDRASHDAAAAQRTGSGGAGRAAAARGGEGKASSQRGGGEATGQGQRPGEAGVQAQGASDGEAQGQGQGGGQGRGGATSDDGLSGRESRGSPSGSSAGGAPGVNGARETITAKDARQLSRELGARRDDAERLRRAARDAGADTKGLDRAINSLRGLDGATLLGDPAAMQRLRDEVVENLKNFEFALRRALGTADAGGPALGGSERVPAQYRDMVDEYFKALSRKP